MSADGLQHVSTYLDGRQSRQREIDAYLTSGRCVNDPPSRAAFRAPPVHSAPPPVYRPHSADDEVDELMRAEMQADAMREDLEAQRQRDWERDQREQQQREFEQRMTATQAPPPEEKTRKYQNDDAVNVLFDEFLRQPASGPQPTVKLMPQIEPDDEPFPF